MIADIPVGKTIDIKVMRKGKTKTLKVEIAKRPEDAKIANRHPDKETGDELGIQVSEVTPDIARRFKITETDGVIVMNVESGGKGEEAGIQPGDIIKEINHNSIKKVKDFQTALGKVEKGDAVSMFIKRINRGFLVIKLVK
jgi:serine protease Do